MRRTKDQHCLFATAVSICCLLSGCASLVNPYVHATPEANAATLNPSDLTKATAYAQGQMNKYREALTDRAYLRNVLPLFLVPLGAALVYRGAVSHSDDVNRAIIGGSLAGAAAYGLGSYYNSGMRERVYVAGIKALSCAKHSAAVYDLSSSEVNKLESAKSKLDAALRALDEHLARRDDYEPVSSRQAQNARSEGRRVLQRADAFEAVRRATASDLTATVERISVEVDEQIERMEPDISGILSTVGNLGAVASGFGPLSVQGQGGKTAAGDGAQGPRPGAVQKVEQKKIDDVVVASIALDQMLRVREDMAKRAGNPMDCRLDSIASDFDVSPPNDEVLMQPHSEQQFVVRGGTGIPNAYIIGLAGSGTTRPVILSNQVQGNTLLVTAKYGATVDGIDEVVVEFTDGAKMPERRRVRLKLAPASNKVQDPAGAAVAAPKSPKDTAQCISLSLQERAEVMQKLGLPTDTPEDAMKYKSKLKECAKKLLPAGRDAAIDCMTQPLYQEIRSKGC